MKITFLGTSSGCPTRSRNMSSIGLQLPQKGVLWLFDCGEGTQHQVLRSPLRLSQLEKVFITHLHGDHLFGLPGLLASHSLQGGGTTPITLYGPAGLEEVVRVSLDRSETRLTYPVRIETIREGLVWEDEAFRVVCAPMEHRVEAFGFAVLEKDLPGHFDVAAATALGVPAGPLFGRLKRGEAVVLPDGRTIRGADLVGPPRPGRKLVYCGDTTFTPRAVALALGADLLIHEATNLEEDRALASRAGHSTAAMAAEVARQAGVRMLLLTHFSPRYESDTGSRLGDLLAEAQAIFPDTRLAHDFLSYEVPPRDALAHRRMKA